MDELTIILWLWNQPGYFAGVNAGHVNNAAAMIARHTTVAHRIVCITDQPDGVEVETIPLWEEFSTVNTPLWGDTQRYPQAHRRLKLFDPAMGEVLGDRFVSMDLDIVVLDSLDSLFSREEEFVICRSPNPTHKYVSPMWMLTAGSRSDLYYDFTPEKAAEAEKKYAGSDQAWINYKLSGQATWGEDDGIRYFHPKMKYCPRDCSIVFFNGNMKPWDGPILEEYPWIRENYG